MSNLDKLKDVFSPYVLPDTEITPLSSFTELGLDSISVVEAVIKLEEIYGEEITLTENVKSMGDILKQMSPEEGE